MIARLLRQRLTLSARKRALLRVKNAKLFQHAVAQEQLHVAYRASDEPGFIQEASTVLQKNGVVIVDGMVPQLTACKAGEEFALFIEEAKARLSEADCYEDEQLLVQTNRGVLKDYSQLANYNKPVLNLRKNSSPAPDAGMIDIFRFDALVREYENLNSCYELITRGAVEQVVLAQGNDKIKHQQLNGYFNESVIETRELHVDSLKNSYKVFVYLSDVDSLAKGPFSYVPESHNKKNAIASTARRNRLYKNVASTDMHLTSDNAIQILGIAGTVIISCQHGVHGGYPQTQGATRMVMVDNYYCHDRQKTNREK